MQKACFKIFKEDTEALSKTRRNMKLTINSTGGVKKYENKINNKNLSSLIKYEELREEEQETLRTKLAAEDDREMSHQEDSEVEDDDEVNSGW